MAYGVGKKDNSYARELFDIDAPKTVWMALVFALARRIVGEERPIAEVVQFVRNEWAVLHQNGIVPQRPRYVAAETAVR